MASPVPLFFSMLPKFDLYSLKNSLFGSDNMKPCKHPDACGVT